MLQISNPTMSTAFAAFAARSLRSERFTFIDVGCSGGLDPTWRVFGEKLQALGFDASTEECERLTLEEAHPDIKYVNAFAGLSKDSPFARLAADNPFFFRDLTPRSSAGRMNRLRHEKLKAAALDEKFLHNAWDMTKLADPEKPVIVPEFLKELGWPDVDFLKIDIDSIDFQVLNSFSDDIEDFGLLAAQLEVNFFGGVGETEHVFHNTDRFMRARGFELFGLDVRTYSMAALPAPFANREPAQTVTGRPGQGDALYARDPASPEWADAGTAMRPEKLAKLAAIFSVWRQPDSAAEILVRFRDKLGCVFDVDVGLEFLAGQAQAQAGAKKAISYSDFMAEFEAGTARFFPPPWVPWTPPKIRKRLAAAFKAFIDPNSVSN